MTLNLNKGDRLYKIIDGRTFSNEFKRFISKIDENGKVTILTYIYNIDDIKDDGTIDPKNKRMMLLIKGTDKEGFEEVININYRIYPKFEIILEKDYSDKPLEDALELMNLEGNIKANVSIKSIIDEIKK